jgi:tight adherence protein B
VRTFQGMPMMALMKYGGVVLVIAGFALVAIATFFGDTVLTRYYKRYIAYLDRNLRLLFLPGEPEKLVIGQVVAAAVVLGVAFTMDSWIWYAFLALTAIAPWLYLRQKRAEHLKKLEDQVDSFILGLANSLKTVPSPSAALSALVPVLPNPTKLEVERVLREMRVGSTLEQALLNMTSRLKSQTMDQALSAVLIGLQVGGNLPVVLENTASTIREMNRLDGVVKTKTSEGRAQLWVLALFPFFICGAFNYVEEGYFEPLQTTVTGYIVTMVAIGFWMASLIVARKILKVDI